MVNCYKTFTPPLGVWGLWHFLVFNNVFNNRCNMLFWYETNFDYVDSNKILWQPIKFKDTGDERCKMSRWTFITRSRRRSLVRKINIPKWISKKSIIAHLSNECKFFTIPKIRRSVYHLQRLRRGEVYSYILVAIDVITMSKTNVAHLIYNLNVDADIKRIVWYFG